MNPIVLLSVICLSTSLVSGAAQTAKSFRFWDCCKPSCAWNKAATTAPVQDCEKDGVTASANGNIASACGGGGSPGKSYLCNDQQPWAVNKTLSFGFAGSYIDKQTETDWCCSCYELKSEKLAGKTFVVQASSSAGDLKSGSYFDLYMPGGGFGAVNKGCTDQWDMAMSGLTTAAECDKIPTALQPGCKWHFDWFENADNPDFTYTRVQCPKSIIAKTKCQRNDDKDIANAAYAAL